MTSAVNEMIGLLTQVLVLFDPYLARHVLKVSDYSRRLATAMQLDDSQIEEVGQAALLHDIGKMGLSQQILQKNTRLTEEEFEYIKSHTIIGATLLESTASLRLLAPLVRSHHERWDGKGYPDGLRGDQIPWQARIIAVCDAVEAMASDRPYHRGRSLPEITSELKRASGNQFDPQMVKAFVPLLEYEGGALVVNSAHNTPAVLANLNGNAPPNNPYITQLFPVDKLRDL
jgi:putative nucleotidyltransferase with HDIG domain